MLVVNGDNEADTPDFDRQSVWKILVGGAKLSRGYTIEGLTTSYYRRRTQAANTLMQMGRWFGYRQNYGDLVRLFVGRAEGLGKPKFDLYEAFGAACQDEEDFRQQLRRYSSEDGTRITPREVPPLVASSLPWLKPTSPNKMFNAKIAQENFGATWIERTVVPTRKSDISANLKLTTSLMELAGLETETLKADRDRFDVLGLDRSHPTRYASMWRSVGGQSRAPWRSRPSFLPGSSETHD